jgi:guanylate kinase
MRFLRLKNRGQDDDEIISKRMENAEREMSHYEEFDYIIINEQFDSALIDLMNIIDDFGNNIKNTELLLENQLISHRYLFKELI